MKKIFIAIGLLGATFTSALAGGPELMVPATPAFFNGLYAGAGIGGVEGDFKTQVSSRETDNDTKTSSMQTDFRGNAVGDFFLGYGRSFQPIYLGAEIFASVSRLKSSYNNDLIYLNRGLIDSTN